MIQVFSVLISWAWSLYLTIFIFDSSNFHDSPQEQVMFENLDLFIVLRRKGTGHFLLFQKATVKTSFNFGSQHAIQVQEIIAKREPKERKPEKRRFRAFSSEFQINIALKKKAFDWNGE